MSKDKENKETAEAPELTVEQLKERNAQLKDQLVDLEKLNEVLQTELAKEKANVAEHKDLLEEAVKLNDELNASLEGAESKPSSGKPTFNVGKETYELVIPKSKYKGKEVTAVVLKEDKELLKKLVEIKAGCLRLVEKEGGKS